MCHLTLRTVCSHQPTHGNQSPLVVKTSPRMQIYTTQLPWRKYQTIHPTHCKPNCRQLPTILRPRQEMPQRHRRGLPATQRRSLHTHAANIKSRPTPPRATAPAPSTGMHPQTLGNELPLLMQNSILCNYSRPRISLDPRPMRHVTKSHRDTTHLGVKSEHASASVGLHTDNHLQNNRRHSSQNASPRTNSARAVIPITQARWSEPRHNYLRHQLECYELKNATSRPSSCPTDAWLRTKATPPGVQARTNCTLLLQQIAQVQPAALHTSYEPASQLHPQLSSGISYTAHQPSKKTKTSTPPKRSPPAPALQNCGIPYFIQHSSNTYFSTKTRTVVQAPTQQPQENCKIVPHLPKTYRHHTKRFSALSPTYKQQWHSPESSNNVSRPPDPPTRSAPDTKQKYAAERPQHLRHSTISPSKPKTQLWGHRNQSKSSVTNNSKTQVNPIPSCFWFTSVKQKFL